MAPSCLDFVDWLVQIDKSSREDTWNLHAHYPLCQTILLSTTLFSRLKSCELSLSFLDIWIMFHLFDLESKSLRQVIAIS